jgi:uncharacterized BrkB/YihY/UPF0761 family membrane protein
MEETKKTWIEDIKKNWKETPNSVKFWNGLVLLSLIVTGLLDLEILSVVLFIMSIAAFAVFLDDLGQSDDYLDNHIWIWFTPLSWGMLILVLILMGSYKFYKGTIVKFNNWLNKR